MIDKTLKNKIKKVKKLNDKVTVIVFFNKDNSFNRLINTCVGERSSVSSNYNNLSKEYQAIVLEFIEQLKNKRTT